eukprot:1194579-Prorocentrum_minimum.AAC.3
MLKWVHRVVVCAFVAEPILSTLLPHPLPVNTFELTLDQLPSACDRGGRRRSPPESGARPRGGLAERLLERPLRTGEPYPDRSTVLPTVLPTVPLTVLLAVPLTVPPHGALHRRARSLTTCDRPLDPNPNHVLLTLTLTLTLTTCSTLTLTLTTCDRPLDARTRRNSRSACDRATPALLYACTDATVPTRLHYCTTVLPTVPRTVQVFRPPAHLVHDDVRPLEALKELSVRLTLRAVALEQAVAGEDHVKRKGLSVALPPLLVLRQPLCHLLAAVPCIADANEGGVQGVVDTGDTGKVSVQCSRRV